MKNKKEFFGVLISVFVCVFIVALIVYATTTVGDDITIGGNDLTFGNGAALSNAASNDLLTLTETLVSIDGKASVSGDLTIEGNDLTFGNGAVLSNAASNDLLTLTETLVSIDGKASVSGTFYAGGTATFAVGASVSDDISMAKASISDQLVIGAARIFSGTASITQALKACNIGDIYIMTGTAGILNTLSICDGAGTWTKASISDGG